MVRFSRTRTRLFATTALAGSLAALSPAAQANPQGGTVVGGSATIGSPVNGRLDVRQHTGRAIINWDSFSIGAGEHTRFRQPSSTSVVLNRVTGDDPSSILGRLSANGQVWLVNPNGVFFGRGAVVDVAGLLATTHDIADQDFMAGRYVFRQRPGAPAASIVNEGSITIRDAGLAGFVAPHVANHGVISARLGAVTLASGSAFTLDLYGDHLFNLVVNGEALALPDDVAAAVANTGKIFADGGSVLLSADVAKGVVDNVVDMSGVVQARSIAEADGEIVLSGGDAGSVQVSGRLDAAGAGAGRSGGTVKVLGDQIELAKGSVIDASGAAGGGTVLVGGGWQGKGETQRSTRTEMAAGAVIHADATAKGDGGTVVLWSDGHTTFRGTITADGGATGGDGGRIETSGKLTLSAAGWAHAGAPRGKAGQWLLDPENLVITEYGSDSLDSQTGVYTAPYEWSSLYLGSILGALSSTNVTLTASGDIMLDSPLEYSGSAGRTLTMVAGGDIQLIASILSAMAPLNLDLKSTAGGILFDGEIDLKGGSLTARALGVGGWISQPIASYAGISAGAVTLVAGGDIEMPGDNRFSGPFNATAGSTIDVWASEALTVGNVTAGSWIDLAAASDVVVNGQVRTTDAAVSSIMLFSTTGEIRIAGSGAIDNDSAEFGWVHLQADRMDIQGAVTAPRISIGPNNGLRDITIGSSASAADSGTLDFSNSELNNLRGDVDMDTDGMVRTVGAVNLTGAYETEFTATRIEIRHDISSQGSLIFEANGQDTGGVMPFRLWSGTTVYARKILAVLADDMRIDGNLRSDFRIGLLPYADGRRVRIGAVSDVDAALDLSAAELSRVVAPHVMIASSDPFYDFGSDYYGYSTSTDPHGHYPEPDSDYIPLMRRWYWSGGTLAHQDPSPMFRPLVGSLDVVGSVDVSHIGEFWLAGGDVNLSAGAAIGGGDAVRVKAGGTLSSGADSAITARYAVHAEASSLGDFGTAMRATAGTGIASLEGSGAEQHASLLQASATVVNSTQSATPTHPSSTGSDDSDRTDRATREVERRLDNPTPQVRSGDTESSIGGLDGDGDDSGDRRPADRNAGGGDDVAAGGNPPSGSGGDGPAPLPASPSARVRDSAVVREGVALVNRVLGSGGSVHDAVKALTEAPGEMSNAQLRAVFEAVPAATIVASLTGVKDPTVAALGQALQNTLSSGRVSQGEMRAVLAQGGFDAETRRTYLNIYQRVRHEHRTNLFGSALAELRANPQAGSIFPNAGRRTRALTPGGGVKSGAAGSRLADELAPSVVHTVGLAGFSDRGLAEVKGKIGLSTPFARVHVNGRWVFVDENGDFAAELPLDMGPNEVVVEITDEDGQVRSHSLIVESPRSTPAAPPPPAKGRKLAVLFAVSQYADPLIPPLETPAADVEAVAAALNETLGYETRVVRNAGREQIVEELRKIGRSLEEEDEVTVYYAGHGYAMEETGMGYWLPADAKALSAEQWISNEDVARLLNRMPARHVMLVADSCYSGAFTREAQGMTAEILRDPAQVIERRAVMAMSSGDNEPVLDGDVNSPFAAALIGQVKGLGAASGGIDLFQKVQQAVSQDNPQTPQYGVVLSAGYDKGGDFLFRPRPRTGDQTSELRLR